MANYAQLRTRVQENVIDLPTAVLNRVPVLVQNAHREAMRRHNFWFMRAQTTRGTTVGQRNLDSGLPADWKEARGDPWYTEVTGEARFIYWAGARDELLRAYGDDPDLDFGYPHYLYADEPTGDEDPTSISIEVWPFPDGLSTQSDGEYDITIPYWKFLPALSADSDSDWITANGDEWIEFKATAEAFFRDWDEERGTLWLQRAETELAKLRRLDKNTVVSQLGGTIPFNPKGVNAPGLRR